MVGVAASAGPRQRRTARSRIHGLGAVDPWIQVETVGHPVAADGARAFDRTSPIMLRVITIARYRGA